MVRTTVAADESDLARLRQEATRRGVTLSVVLAEAVAAAAAALRETRRPRFGLGASGVGAAAQAQAHPQEPYETEQPRG